MGSGAGHGRAHVGDLPVCHARGQPSYKPTWRGDTSWVDGGYSDNFGMASILDWLQEALTAPNWKSCAA